MKQNQDNSQIELLIEKLASKEDDAFDYRSIAKNLANILAKMQSPFVYAVCGGWGTGKSTFLKFLINELPSFKDKVIIIYFNAWRASIHKNILVAFVHEIYSQILSFTNDKKMTSSTELGEVAKKLFDDSIAIALGLLGTAGQSIHKVYKDLKTGFTDGLKKQLEAESEIRDRFKALGNKLSETDHTVYVLIDELDRCTPKSVVNILESIKMLFFGSDELLNAIKEKNGKEPEKHKVPFKYIISMDEDYVSKAFARFYKLDLIEARYYTSKFIHGKYHFPNKDWKVFVEKIINRLPENKEWIMEGSIKDFSEILSISDVSSPREANRILGYLFFWQQRDFEGVEKELKSRSPINKTYEENYVIVHHIINLHLLAIACIKVLFPSEMELVIKRNTFFYIFDFAQDDKIIADNLKSLSTENNPDSISKLKLNEFLYKTSKYIFKVFNNSAKHLNEQQRSDILKPIKKFIELEYKN